MAKKISQLPQLSAPLLPEAESPFVQNGATVRASAAQLGLAYEPAWSSGSVVNYYVNSASGNDGNTGLSSNQALSTLAEAMRRVGSVVRGPTIINVTGHNNADCLAFRREYLGHLAIKGTPIVTVPSLTVASGGVVDAYNLDFGSPGWTANQHRAFALRSTSGSNAGLMRTIIGNTPDVVRTDSWPSAVVAGDTFEIVDVPHLVTSGTMSVPSPVTGWQATPHLVFVSIGLSGSFSFAGSVSFYGTAIADATYVVLSAGTVWSGRNPPGSLSWAISSANAQGFGLAQRGTTGDITFKGAMLVSLRGYCLIRGYIYSGSILSLYGGVLAPASTSHAVSIAYGGNIQLLPSGSPNQIDTTNGSLWIEEGASFYLVDPAARAFGANRIMLQGSKGEISPFDCDCDINIDNGSSVQFNGPLTGDGSLGLGSAATVPFSRFAFGGDSVMGSFGTAFNSGSVSEFATGTVYGPRSSDYNGPLCSPDFTGECLDATHESGSGTFAVPDGQWIVVTAFSSTAHPVGGDSAKLLAKLTGGAIVSLRGAYGFDVGEQITIAEVNGTAVVGAPPVWEVQQISGTAEKAVAAGSQYRNTLYGYRFRSDAGGNWVTGEANSGQW